MARALLRRPTGVETNGDSAFDAESVALVTPRRRRPSWVLVGALLVGLSGLVGAWVFASSTERMSVMVAARDLEPGELVSATDLRVVELGRSGQLRAVQPDQQDLIVGRATRGPIPAGTVLNTDLVAREGASIPAGMVVVGAALEPGAAPVARLRAGDAVDVLGVVRATGTVAGEVGAGPVAEVLTSGSVWSVEAVGSGSVTSRVWVSVLIPEDAQGAVAQAASDELLRLSLVGAPR